MTELEERQSEVIRRLEEAIRIMGEALDMKDYAEAKISHAKGAFYQAWPRAK